MTQGARAGPAAAAGWTLMEVMVAMAIVATGLLVLVQQLSISFRESTANEDRAFAFEKAAALLSEIDNAIEQGVITEAVELQALQDATNNVVLTTRRDAEELPFAPEHPMSGNVRRQGQWIWSRRIHVLPHQQSDLQYCRVEVYRRTETGSWHLEASLAQVFSLLPDTDAPQQTFDVYVLAIGAAPSAWGDLGELRTHVETAASSIALHAQAGFRLHWITRLGYGRDPCYAPYVNTEEAADATAPWGYWLPGVLGGAQTGQRLYRSELLGALHRTEAGLVGGRTATDPLPVTVADRNNHCMRAPAARELFEQRVAAGLEAEDEPPLQLLLDDLVQRPERYRNAIFVNLHGSALPCPPLRNYADPARDPAGRPGVRVVTHPARLQTPRDPNGDGDHADTVDLELRVHAWRTQGSGNVLAEPIHVRIHGGDFTSSINGGANATMLVNRLPGGVDPFTGATGTMNCVYFGFDSSAAVAPTAPEAPFAMYYEAGFVGGADPYTWLKLYNTPLVAPQFSVQGLHPDGRLYGLDYVPSPVAGSFARDLAYPSTARAMRNTARWRIRVCKRAFAIGALPDADAVVRVETSIGADPITGQRWPVPIQPLNRSETFAWWTRSSDAVPPTERAQFLGDPRLCPYADLMAGAGPLANGYNWHFDDLRNGPNDARALWPCLDGARLQDGFGAGERADAPRFLQLFRQALQQAGAVLVSPTGTLANELVLGGEIAVAGAPASLQPVTLHASWGGGTTPIDTVAPGTSTGERVLARGAWWAKPWLGELFPDDLWPQWYEHGNLPLLSSAPPLHWDLRHAATLAGLPYGTEFARPAGARLGQDGGTMLLDCGDTGHTFVMPARTLEAAPASGAREINTAANLVPPDLASAAAKIDVSGPSFPPPPAFAFTDSYPRSTATQLETLWNAGVEPTAAVVDFARDPQLRGFVVPWSVAGATLPPNADIARQSLLLGLRAQHAAAAPSLPGRIAQVPRLEILAPSASQALQTPTTVELRWKTEWVRFDGHPYRSGLPEPFVESESALVYRVLVSSDDGATWTSALTQQPAVPGVWPEDPADRLADGGTGNESFVVAPAEPWTEDRYTFLVEAWRSDRRSHSASHRVTVFVRE